MLFNIKLVSKMSNNNENKQKEDYKSSGKKIIIDDCIMVNKDIKFIKVELKRLFLGNKQRYDDIERYKYFVKNLYKGLSYIERMNNETICYMKSGKRKDSFCLFVLLDYLIEAYKLNNLKDFKN